MLYPAAIQVPGPADKVWPETNSHIGVILHSEEGYEPNGDAEIANESIQLSWHFTVRKDGVVEQHYPLTASTWHAGTHEWNTKLIGVEHEGMVGEALTPAQLAASIALVNWMAQQCGWKLSRTPQTITLWEHHEVPGAQTTCPNGRIPWDKYLEQDMITEPVVNADEIAFIMKEIAGLTSGAQVKVEKVVGTNPQQYLLTMNS